MMYLQTFYNFLEHEKRYSVNTLISYKTDLNQFQAFCDNLNKEIHCTDSKDIRAWILFLIENKVSARSINRKLSALKSFFKYLVRENIIIVSPVNNITAPKTAKKIPEFVREKEMDDLLEGNYFENDYEGCRDKFIIELFYSTGIRLSELINIKISDIDVNLNSLKVLGKRNKERIIPLSSQTIKKYLEYLKERKKLEEVENEYLFLTKTGNKIYSKLVYRQINKYLNLVSTINRKSPHIIRHTFATHMLNNGADLNAIKELLGHANLAATQIYTHNTFEELKSIYNQAHPRA